MIIIANSELWQIERHVLTCTKTHYGGSRQKFEGMLKTHPISCLQVLVASFCRLGLRLEIKNGTLSSLVYETVSVHLVLVSLYSTY